MAATTRPRLAPQFEAAFPDKSAEVCVGCQSGKRSVAAAQLLAAAGYTGVKNVEGGFMGAWLLGVRRGCAAWVPCAAAVPRRAASKAGRGRPVCIHARSCACNGPPVWCSLGRGKAAGRGVRPAVVLQPSSTHALASAVHDCPAFHVHPPAATVTSGQARQRRGGHHWQASRASEAALTTAGDLCAACALAATCDHGGV